jgi:secondary thiamine-phosphate synthase enzyme
VIIRAGASYHSTAEFQVSTSGRSQFVAISLLVAETIAAHGWRNGVVTVFVPHTTAGVTINENADPDVVRDMESFSSELIPQSRSFRHEEGNSDAHIKASFFGSSVQIIVRNGSMWLGTWQGIFLCEFDGPRVRNVYAAFIES